MEQPRYWMWPKRKHSFSSHIQAATAAATTPTYGDSWEEQAFAEDAAGLLGGCVWPPRSYSCSFCRREFRSAQALGGHMNVHRRDRARLKQSSIPNNEIINHQDQHGHIMSPHKHHLPCTPLDVQYQASQIVNMVYNPISDFVFATPSPQSRVSHQGKTYPHVPFFSSSILDQPPNNKNSSISAPPPWSNLVGQGYFHVPDPNNQKIPLGVKNTEVEDHVIEDNLNLFLQQTGKVTSTDHEKMGDLSCKRRKMNPPPPLLSFLKENSSEGEQLQSEVVDASSSSSSEEIDLELRLGDRPEVK